MSAAGSTATFGEKHSENGSAASVEVTGPPAPETLPAPSGTPEARLPLLLRDVAGSAADERANEEYKGNKDTTYTDKVPGQVAGLLAGDPKGVTGDLGEAGAMGRSAGLLAGAAPIAYVAPPNEGAAGDLERDAGPLAGVASNSYAAPTPPGGPTGVQGSIAHSV